MSFVSGSPSNSFSADPDVRVTSLLAIVSFPAFAVTANWLVTSLLSASFTTAVPVTLAVYSPASVPVVPAVSPLTVYFSPSTVNSVVLSPLTALTVPSYLSLPLFASTSMLYLVFLSVTVSWPSTHVIS